MKSTVEILETTTWEEMGFPRWGLGPGLCEQQERERESQSKNIIESRKTRYSTTFYNKLNKFLMLCTFICMIRVFLELFFNTACLNFTGAANKGLCDTKAPLYSFHYWTLPTSYFLYCSNLFKTFSLNLTLRDYNLAQKPFNIDLWVRVLTQDRTTMYYSQPNHN